MQIPIRYKYRETVDGTSRKFPDSNTVITLYCTLLVHNVKINTMGFRIERNQVLTVLYNNTVYVLTKCGNSLKVNCVV